MLADTTEIHAYGVAAAQHADDLCDVAARLAAAHVAADEFGAIGTEFTAALNEALAQEVDRVRALAAKLMAATTTAGAAADAYLIAEQHAGRAITALGT